MEKLRTNVVNRKYTFEVVFQEEKPNGRVIVEAESLDSAKLKLPAGIMAAKLREIDGYPPLGIDKGECRWTRMPR